MRIFLWLVCLLVIVVPVVALSIVPELYQNPIVVFLLSVAIAVLSVVASRQEFSHQAARKTQTEWLSQAEAACDRLLTLGAHVNRLTNRTKGTCQDAITTLPELQQNNMRAVRTLLERNCEHTAAQLADIADHLDGAVADWKRFIRKTCEGKDCEQIGRMLDSRRAELLRSLLPTEAPTCQPVEVAIASLSQ